MSAKSLLSQLVIEPVSRDTSQLARKVILEGLKEHFVTLNLELNPDLNDILSVFTKPGNLFLIGFLKNKPGEVICTGALVQETPTPSPTLAPVRARIVRVSVKKPYRRKGIAKALVKALEAHARETQVQEILVETTDGWENAKKLYLSLEYQIYDYRDGDCHMKKQI